MVSHASTWYDTVNTNTPDDEAEFCDCGFPDTECTFPDCDAGKEDDEGDAPTEGGTDGM